MLVFFGSTVVLGTAMVLVALLPKPADSWPVELQFGPFVGGLIVFIGAFGFLCVSLFH